MTMENLENNEMAAVAVENAEVTTANMPAEEAKAPAPAMDEAEVARLIAEAEQRGYIRGRNEKIEYEMMGPEDYGLPMDDDSEPCPSFLSHIRPSFWDE